MRPAVKFFFPLLLAPALMSGPAHASATCTASVTSDFSNCILSENGVTISDFSFTGAYAPQAGDQFRLNGNSNRSGLLEYFFIPNIHGLGSPTTGIRTGSFSYKITLAPSSLLSYSFNRVGVGASGSTLDGGQIQTDVIASGLSPSPQYERTGGSQPTSNSGTFSPGLTSRTFTQSFTIDPLDQENTQLTTLTADWTTRSSPVPGPLPLLGAATAFGLSRKLRSRIRSAG